MIGQPSSATNNGAAADHGVWALLEVLPSGTIVSANEAFAACAGRRVADLPGLSFFDLVHPEDRPRAVAMLRTTPDHPVELRLVTAEGDERFLLVGPAHAAKAAPRVLICADVTQQRLAERAARNAGAAARADARRYADVIRSASDWLWEMDAELRYTYFSPNLEMITSIVPSSLIGKRRDEIGDPSLEPELWADHWATLNSHKPFRDFVYGSKQSDGRLLWIKVSGTPILADDGRFLGYRGVASDVTSQRAAERAVAESERRLRELFEVSSDWHWETDPEGRFTFLSSTWSKVTGQDPGEFLGRRRDDFGDRAVDTEAWQAHLSVLAARKPFRNFTYCLRSTTGASRWIRTTGIPVFDEKRAFAGYRGAASDVTSEMEATRTAQATYQRFAEAIESVPASLMVHDADDRLVICNSITREYFPELVHLLVPGSKFEDLVRTQAETGQIPEADGRTEAWLQERMARHRLQENVITRRYRDGRWVQTVERQMSDGGTIALRLDITALKNAEEQRLALEAQLHHSQRLEALGTLAGGVAHELNNTLVPILALAKTTARRLPEHSRERNNLDIISQASERARTLVAQILAFSRKEVSVRRKVDCAALTRDALKLLRASLPSTIKVDQRIAAVPPVLGDPGQLHQVIVNLVANAAQAIDGQLGTITVAVAIAPDERLTQEPQELPRLAVRLSVSDSGCGMDQATVARIFEPFFTTKETGKGTGLGLSVVHGIITQHGGRITVESQVGQGTRFDVYLPVDTAEEATALSGQAVETARALA